jgi:hypothetical protein
LIPVETTGIVTDLPGARQVSFSSLLWRMPGEMSQWCVDGGAPVIADDGGVPFAGVTFQGVRRLTIYRGAPLIRVGWGMCIRIPSMGLGNRRREKSHLPARPLVGSPTGKP